MSVEAGLSMPGVFEASLSAPFAQIIDALLLLTMVSLERVWDNRIVYISLR